MSFLVPSPTPAAETLESRFHDTGVTMYLFGKDSLVENWAGVVRMRYRWPIIKDALAYLVNALRGFHIAGLHKE